jgi:hypothetical protein
MAEVTTPTDVNRARRALDKIDHIIVLMLENRSFVRFRLAHDRRQRRRDEKETPRRRRWHSGA